MQEKNEEINGIINPESSTDIITPEVIENSTLEPLIPEESLEEKELTDEEKRELYIQQLKESKIKFRPTHFKRNVEKKITITQPFGGSYHREKVEKIITYDKSVIVSQFDKEYKKKRKNKNKVAKANRKINSK